jgi:hypothetical protein
MVFTRTTSCPQHRRGTCLRGSAERTGAIWSVIYAPGGGDRMISLHRERSPLPMLDDEDLAHLQAKYQERGVPTEWQDMTPDTMAPAFRMYYRALPSPGNNVEGAADAEELIHDPLTALRRAGLISEDEDPHISTLVVNHEKTLNRFIMYASVIVSTNPSTVGITIAKEEE